MISVKDLTLTLNNTIVLDHVSAEFAEGAVTGLVGRNGSGKTVLMKCICGFFKPDSGSVSVGGKIVGRDMDFPEDLGMIRHRIGKKEIYDAMELVGLDPKSKKRVAKYSLGMKQKLGIAQAVMEDPSMIILDEPMNSLDSSSVEDVRKLILQWKSQGKTIILSSHNQEDISTLCDKTYYMKDGKIIDG